MSVNVHDFLQQIENIHKELPVYRLGGYAADGTCDCIGLIIGAIHRSGGEWTGVHGSNYAARYEMETFGTVTEDSLEIGMAVYKAKEPGSSNYALPSRYNDSPDKRDYYHVGVVTSVEPLVITHCTTPTIKQDTKLGSWKYGGRLKKVQYEMKEDNVMRMYVKTPNNGKVNLRKTAQSNGTLIARIDNGAMVECIEECGEWCNVKVNGKTGYIMREFLVDETEQVTPDVNTRIDHLIGVLESVICELKDMKEVNC